MIDNVHIVPANGSRVQLEVKVEMQVMPWFKAWSSAAFLLYALGIISHDRLNALLTWATPYSVRYRFGSERWRWIQKMKIDLEEDEEP